MSFIDITGQRFGRLVVLEYVGNSNWKTICDCGEEKIVRGSHLRYGETKSCGKCPKNKKPNTNYNITYRSWASMKRRCKSNPCYVNRHIKVCNRWSGKNGYLNFLNDMGERPSEKHTIDRIDVNGDYCPENCRWATPKEQSNNKTTNIYLTYNGITKTLSQWSEYYELPYKRCFNRYSSGLSFEEIFDKDLRKRRYTKDEVLAIRKNNLTKRKFELLFNKHISNDMIFSIRHKLSYKNVSD